MLHRATTTLLRCLAVLAAVLLARGASAATPPVTIVVFGATGDLNGRLLTPALMQVMSDLPPGSRVVGVGPNNSGIAGDEAFRGWMKDRVTTLSGKPDDGAWNKFAGRLHYESMDLKAEHDYAKLKDKLGALDAEDQRAGEIQGPRRVVFYYAIPPSLISATTKNLAQQGLIGPHSGNDVVPEKPIGVDAKTAQRVADEVVASAGAEHVYFMDHYNGKPGVQRIRALRQDPRFSRIWNKKYIDHIEVSALESIGAEGRGAFYDPTGAARDMVQSHLLQTLAFTLAPRGRGAANDASAAKIEALETLTADAKRAAVRGQYVAGGKIGDYRAEEGVKPGSTTETYVKLRLKSGVRGMKDVPISIESGKGLAAKQGRVAVRFKQLPAPLALELGHEPGTPATLEVDLNNGNASLGGKTIALAKPMPSRLPYAVQLQHVLDGDHAAFPTSREIQAQWKVIDPLEAKWAKQGDKGLERYKAGSGGPKTARRLAFKPTAKLGRVR